MNGIVKLTWLLAGTIAVVASLCEGQITVPAQAPPAIQIPPLTQLPVAAQTLPGSVSDYAVAQIGPDSLVWQNSAGQSVTAIGTGMNYWDGEEWNPSDPSFAISQDGTSFIATRLQDPTQLTANIATEGAVTVITPDNVTLRSTPMAIGLYDAASGLSVIIASVTNSTGILVDPQHVVYSHAFTGGGIDAGIVYSLPDTGSFHQDVVFTGFNPNFDPTVWGFGANSTNTLQIQIYTEFYNPPQPQVREKALYIEQDPNVRAQMASPDFIDHFLDFGHYVFIPGKAYSTPTYTMLTPGVAVAKDFITSSGRTFLVESIPYISLAAQLRALPPVRTSSLKGLPGAKKMKVAAASVPQFRADKSDIREQLTPAKAVALASSKKLEGVSVDYTVTVSSLNEPALYASDTTYFVTNNVYLMAPVTIESAVFKFATNNTAGTLAIYDTLTMATTNYRPALFTAADDNTVGATLSTSIWADYTGTVSTNYYGMGALFIETSSNIWVNNIRISDLYTGIAGYLSSVGLTVTLSQSQMVNVSQGTDFTGTGGTDPITFNMNNCLFSHVRCPFIGDSVVYTGNAYNCTVDASPIVSYMVSTTGNLNFTNSIFSGVSTFMYGSVSMGGANNGFYGCASTFGGSPQSTTNNPFQSAFAGLYYLTNTSSFATNGTTNVPASVLSQLQIKTTHAPAPLNPAPHFAVDTVLSPVAQRDTAGISIGFHYEPIDYWGACSVSNATLYLTGGVVLAYFDSALTWLEENARLVSQGTPNQRNCLVYYTAVQEEPYFYWPGTVAQAQPFAPSPPTSSGGPSVFLRLTSIYQPTGATNFWTSADPGAYFVNGLTLQDCEVYGSGSSIVMNESANTPNVGFTNNVFYRVPFAVNSNAKISSFNNLFYGTTNTNEFSISIQHRSGAPSPNTNENNVFDGVTATLDGVVGYNAYLHGATNTAFTNNHDIITNITWQGGPSGGFYQPASSPLLTNGSTFATNLGLYHYTVLTDEQIEATNIVSRGYHYVALGANGLPLDSNTNGTPDYLADANGDGIFDNGEIPWYDVPVIFVQPSIDSSYNITGLSAGGTPQLKYQWQSNGVALSGQTTANYYSANNGPGHFTALVSNAFGIAISAGVDVVAPPEAMIYSGGTFTQVVNPGDSVIFYNPSPFGSLQWEWNGVNLCDATTQTLQITPFDATNAGTYTTGGTIVTTLIVLSGPEIIVQPKDCITPYGSNATFSVTGVGSSFTYQWQFNGASITNATNSALIVSNVTQANAGSYTVVLNSQYTNVPYAVTSYYALLGITEPIITTPTNVYQVEPGTTVSLSNSVAGDALTYQWYKQTKTDAVGSWNSTLVANSANISGATTGTLTLSSLATSDSGVYRLVASSPGTLTTTASQEINLYVDPAITKQPQNQIVDVGNNVTFSVSIWSANPSAISYNWRSNTNGTESLISWATNSTLTLTNITTNYAGTYSVIIYSNSNPVKASSPFNGVLAVRTPIWLTTNSTAYGTNYVTNFNWATTHGSTNYWYCASSSALYTAVLTSSIPHIVHYDAGTFQTTGEETWNYNTAQAGWQHWGNTATTNPTLIQLLCDSNNSVYNTIFASGQHDPQTTPIRTDGFELHDLILDCNASGQTQRMGTNAGNMGTWTGLLTCGNNIVISNVTFIHFGKQGDIENFPLSMIPFEALDENSHLITLYSNITVENCLFTSPATNNLADSGGLTVGVILPSFGQQAGDEGTILNLTNAGFSNCVISNVISDFGWSNGFTALSVQNCVVNGCGSAIYLEIGNNVYYGQNFLFQSNYFTNVNFGVLVNYNDLPQYPLTLGNIGLISNVIALNGNQPAYTYEGVFVIQGPDNEVAIPQIPSLTAKFNKITTGVLGYPHWGMFLGNVANALITDNTFDDSYYAISMWDTRSRQLIDGNALRMPLSAFVASRNTKASQLVEITPWGTTTAVAPIATQQKGDFNLDSSADLFWRNTVTGQNVLWPMNGTNTINTCSPVVSNLLPPMPPGWVVSGTADFTGDCNDDILWTVPGATNVLLWTMMGPSFVSSNWLSAFPNAPARYGVAGIGDFNGDGKTDLLLTNATTTIIRLLNGTTVIQDVTLTHAPPTTNAQMVGVGDLTGTGQADIIWRDYTTGTNYIWLMAGTNWGYTSVFWSEADTNWQIQAVGDFNGDGIADFMWRHTVTGSNKLWLTSNPWSGPAFTNVVLPQLTDLHWTITGPK